MEERRRGNKTRNGIEEEERVTDYRMTSQGGGRLRKIPRSAVVSIRGINQLVTQIYYERRGRRYRLAN